jgi:hypothetical protein
MKVVINKCYGGFSLSHEGIMHYAKLKKMKLYIYKANKTTKLGYKQITDAQNLDPFDLMYCTAQPKTDKDIDKYYFSDRDIKRNDPALVKTVEKLKGEADGRYAKLQVVEIPDDVDWEVEEYDGSEWIAEKHRTWG